LAASRLRVNEAKVVWRVADGEGVLLHADTSAYYGLNETGTLLWEQLAGRQLDSAGLIEWARGHFPNVPPEQLAGDVSEFVRQLEAFQLLERTDEPTQPTGAVDPSMPNGASYERPEITPFGELEKLILSGE
jgi:hypothetical protein